MTGENGRLLRCPFCDYFPIQKDTETNTILNCSGCGRNLVEFFGADIQHSPIGWKNGVPEKLGGYKKDTSNMSYLERVVQDMNNNKQYIESKDREQLYTTIQIIESLKIQIEQLKEKMTIMENNIEKIEHLINKYNRFDILDIKEE